VSKLPAAEARPIVERLLERTKTGVLKWDVFQGVEYTADTENFIYYIKSRDEDDSPPFVLELWKRVPRTTSGNTSVKVAEIVTSSEGSPVNSPLEELYRNVKLVYLGITDLKSDVLRDLE
jgi:hypothetical protein